ncbi:hypothetical protein M422DRAFT_775874 [Sphaerobolus stellatus SS14]|nr:hypothetical protein M422DRAFT_775874 [Sphaerobolus stellatus SS14]
MRVLLILLAVCFSTTASPNFDRCLQEVQQGLHGDSGGRDNNGKPVDVAHATALTYTLCVKACGGEQEPFDWSVFSTQFASWLLPWLSLVSQLPFGAYNKRKNLESVVLALGSPTLAAYSLSLTVLNGHWIDRRLRRLHWTSIPYATKVLSNLQHAPVLVDSGDGLLSSLVSLPQNNAWWKDLAAHLNYTETWSLSAATSVIWVILAYLFTVVDSVSGNNITASVNANGQGVGDLWLWLLPVVIGWLQLSPKSDMVKLRESVKKANEHAYVYVNNSIKEAKSVTRRRAISLQWKSCDPLQQDEQCTVPIYNYSRYLRWVRAANKVSTAFDMASQRLPPNGPSLVSEGKSTRPDLNVYELVEIGPPTHTLESTSEVSNCGQTTDEDLHNLSVWNHQTIGRMLYASILALFLQWGTTGAAIVVVVRTPTRGLGCRSASYVLYGVLSTFVWILLVSSSILADFALHADYTMLTEQDSRRRIGLRRRLSTFTRRLGKSIAYFNAVWVILTCVFQFSNFYDRCYCNSSIFAWHGEAYAVIQFTQSDISSTRLAWIGGVILAGSSAGIFTFVLTMLMDKKVVPE